MLKKLLIKTFRPLGSGIILLIAFFCLMSSEFYTSVEDDSIIKKILSFSLSFESSFYDSRMRKNIKTHEKSPDIVLVTIDDVSLSKLGHWPLKRSIYADLLRKLQALGSKTVAFDILFPERSPGDGPGSPDAQFAQAMKDFQQGNRRVFISYTLVEPSAPEEMKLSEFPDELLNDTINTKQDADLTPFAINAYNYPIAEFTGTDAGLGHINSDSDTDGVFRDYQLLANVDGIYLGSLGFSAYQAWSGETSTVEIFRRDKWINASLSIKGENLEINERGKTTVRYWGGLNQFRSFSLHKVLAADPGNEAIKELFDGKLVFVGSTAEGAHDLRHTPLSPTMPGVLAHMNIAHMLNHGYFFKPKEDSIDISLILLFFGTFLFILIHRFDSPFLDAATIAVLIAGSYAADYYYFLPEGYDLKLFYCYFCFISTYSWNTFLNFYEANKEKRQIKGTFARYVAPTVVDEMLKDPENIQVGGTRKDITCLFSDVRDFTSISEGLSAQDLANVLNDYMNQMTDIVFETKGTLDKYIGDAIVALWGAPVSIGNHAQFAVEAAVRMAEAMPALNDEFRRKGFPEFHVGIGLNTGECSVGNMGSTRIFSYTALGDNMNLGARLEGLCKYYGTQILISENTLNRLDKNSVTVRPIDKVIVKGRTKAVEIYEVITRVHFMHTDPHALQFYLTGHQLFGQKNFKGAIEVFDQILASFPEDKPTLRLKQLSVKYHEAPDTVKEDFDVTKMTEK